jgi:hypothetical protein
MGVLSSFHVTFTGTMAVSGAVVVVIQLESATYSFFGGISGCNSCVMFSRWAIYNY